MARIQTLDLSTDVGDDRFLVIIDMVEPAQLAQWRTVVSQVRLDAGATGVIVTSDRLDVALGQPA